MTNQILMAIAVVSLIVGAKLPSIMRRAGNALRDFKFTDNGYVEIER